MITAISSFVDNYKSKVKNPLIGTIISVWIIHNWKIVYAVFNFDVDCTMLDKINFINDYFTKKNFWCEIFTISGIAFAVIVGTFALLALSRIITDGYYKIVEPKIITKIDESAILTESDKKRLEDRIQYLSTKNTSLNNEISQKEQLNKNLTDFIVENDKKTKANSEKHKEEIRLKQLEFNKELKTLKDKNQLLESDFAFFSEIAEDFQNTVKLLETPPYSKGLNLKTKRAVLEKDKVNFLFLEKGYVTINDKGDVEYTLLGRNFIKFWESYQVTNNFFESRRIK